MYSRRRGRRGRMGCQLGSSGGRIAETAVYVVSGACLSSPPCTSSGGDCSSGQECCSSEGLSCYSGSCLHAPPSTWEHLGAPGSQLDTRWSAVAASDASPSSSSRCNRSVAAARESCPKVNGSRACQLLRRPDAPDPQREQSQRVFYTSAKRVFYTSASLHVCDQQLQRRRAGRGPLRQGAGARRPRPVKKSGVPKYYRNCTWRAAQAPALGLAGGRGQHLRPSTCA
jgi:hypothetical protein